MTAPLAGGVTGPVAPTSTDARAALRAVAHELEGVFMTQLFAAMRASVPQGGLVESGAGRDLFTSMLDDCLADLAAQRLRGGVGDALYRQLSRALGTAAPRETE